jgi:hypothetical protein
MAGCALPASLYGADAGNPTGYWEPKEALRLNSEFLRDHLSALGDPRLTVGDRFAASHEDLESFVEKVSCFLRNVFRGRVLVVKDPQITELVELWLLAARRVGLEPVIVIAIRNPNEFIQSATSRVSALGIGSSEGWMAAFWLKYNLLAERRTRDLRRVVVDYANFVTDWRAELRRLSSCLELQLAEYDEAEIEKFVSRDLYRARNAGPIIDPFCMPWLETTYAVLSRAAAGYEIEEAVLDRVFKEYESCERTFRTAFLQFDASLNHPGRNRRKGEGIS